MKYCPITYEKINSKDRYSEQGLRSLSPSLKHLKDFPYTAEEQRKEAAARSSKLSIQGIQPKLSAILSIKDERFNVVDRGGRYILKPQVEVYQNLPENEDLTMKLAATVHIETPTHGLIHSKDGSLTYFIRRFDRKGQKDKIHIEDFAQLSGESRDTKYESSMEKVAAVIEKFCTFPVIEKLKLFERTLFSFIIGNEDMHLKNFSLICRDEKVELSPAYDLVNSTIALTATKEELALPIRSKKSRITRDDLVNYFAIQRLGITEAACDSVIKKFLSASTGWRDLVSRSFLPEKAKRAYCRIIDERFERIAQ